MKNEQDRVERESQLRRQRAALLLGLIKNEIPDLYRYARIRRLSVELGAILKSPESVLLWGGTGTGKTYASMAALRDFIRVGATGKRITFENLLAKIRKFDESEESILIPFFESTIVIIDDIGQSDSDFAARTLFRIIDHRMEYRKKTIITSNLQPEVLKKSIGERIFSRFQTYKIIKLSGNDKRESQRN